jgi:catechol 2,3-dioxygenase-like lactoylglutathione lyase family enzyme
VSHKPAFDHIALTVPDVAAQVERLVTAFGMEVRLHNDFMAIVVDPATDVKFELSASPDDEVHVRHLGFRAEDVDASHASLLADGMETARPPQRQDFAAMYTSFLTQPGGVEVQLVKYDE